MDITKYRFYVGTTRGLLLCTGDKPNDLNVWKNTFSSEVTAISDGRRPDEIILGYQNGMANTFSTESQSYSQIEDLEGDESVTGVGYIGKNIVISKKDGIINMWRQKRNDFFSINLDEKGSLDAMMCHPNKENIIGTGGEFNDFKTWDINTKQCIFKAKSLSHDELQLPIPTSVRGISFFPNEPQLASCCTKEGHILLYDERAQRKPVVKFLEKQASYTCISCGYRERQILAGTTKGYLQWIDLKANKVLKTYTNFTGSVTSIVCDSVEPHITTTSLDRYLRVHHLETKELLFKCYMKQNLTKLLVKPVVKDEDGLEKDKGGAEVVADEEYEDLFNNMEVVKSDKKIKKTKRKSIAGNEKKKKKICV
ncbi:WD repeat domain 74 lethal (2) k09848 [Rhynchophorus ferrugineus]|uniref:WD repeat domain 74 lethal (2) k09848 n=1 Tax=Rhynchophorus ferrugineus TaxID=354439 RepID=UPI003FCEB10C